MATFVYQQGHFLAKLIRREVQLSMLGQTPPSQTRKPFNYVDKGSMATIGRSRAIVEVGRIKLTGFLAWMMWLLVHIYFLTGFKNRTLVVLQWGWSYISFRRGARLIVNKEWRQHPHAQG